MRRAPTLLLLFLFVCTGCVSPRPLPAGHLLPTGTRVSLAVPEGFQEARGFVGYETQDQLSVIMVTEIRGSARSTFESFNPGSIANQGMRLLDQERFEVDGYPARLYHLAQTLRDVPYHKWVLAFGNSSRTVLITAMTPDATRAQFEAPLRAALATARWYR